ncbi:MAG TPA: ABC transporter substrate-binding protein [Trebonia sp.]|nr:ABC transporter substrate-binding protein [Trebonia sp.]
MGNQAPQRRSWRSGRSRLRLAIGMLACLAVAGLTLAGCSSGAPPGSSSGSAASAKGGTVSYGFVSGSQPNWIFPYDTAAYSSVSDLDDLQQMLYRPLYWFGGQNDQPTVDYGLSVANPPAYSDGGKTVMINLKGWKWSDGETVDAQDVVFWLNMMKAEAANYYGYVPGDIPDDITSLAQTGPEQVTLHLNAAYSSLWYTYNELSQITPMPAAWDVTSAGAKPGSGGCATDTAKDSWAKCKAVYNFLTAQAEKAGTYATSPIWTIVDGPWKLQTFNADGDDLFVPNPAYSGSPKPQLAAVKYVTYTSPSAQYTALQTGQLDIGQVPEDNLPPKPASGAPSSSALPNYTLDLNYTFSFYFYRVNFNNPAMGPVFKQLYVRQALEYVADQTGMSQDIYRGYGYPTTGPAPTEPTNQWDPTVEQGTGPYPFSIPKAVSLLTSHGWSEVGGVMTCEIPAKCGTGIAKGTRLAFTMDYATSVAGFPQEVDVYKSDASKAGIDVTTVGETFDAIIGADIPCSPGPSCSWQASMLGGWTYGPDYEPTGEETFATGAGANKGSYSNAEMNKLIAETNTSGSLTLYHQFATYAAEQLPDIYMPNAPLVYAVSDKVHGVVLNPLETLMPEYWSLTG